MNKANLEAMKKELYEAIVRVDSVEGCVEFLEDLCSFKEVEKMAQRVIAARLLMEGKTYAQVIAETEISSATLSRVSRCVQYGKGYAKYIKPLNTDKKE